MTRRLYTVASALLALLAVSAGRAEAQLINADFESGALGPWFNSTDLCGGDAGCQDWSVSAGVGRGGSFGASNRGNILLRQDLASAVAVSDLTELSFWARHDRGSVMAWFVAYSDATTQEFVVSTSADWQKFTITGLDASKSIVAVGAYGVSPPDNTAFLDDWTMTTVVPEPSAIALLATGLVAMGVAVRRRQRIG